MHVQYGASVVEQVPYITALGIAGRSDDARGAMSPLPSVRRRIALARLP